MYTAGFLFVGLGIGLWFDQPGPGVLIGLGLGLIVEQFFGKGALPWRRKGQSDD